MKGNMLLHGIFEKEIKAGTIVLTGWIESDAAVIVISDDGVGIPAAKLNTLLTEKEEQAKGSGHIGVYNTHRRLQILFGAAYGLNYKSTPGQGTDVEIRIPRYAKKGTLLHTGAPGNTGNDADPLSLVAVSTVKTGHTSETVTPDKLSHNPQNFPGNILNVENFHNVFREFPQGGNIFLIAYYVTEPYPEHSHDYYELNYLYRGSLVNTINGHDVYMSAGDLIMINLRTGHSLTPKSDNCLLLNICLRKEFFRKVLRHTIRKHSALNSLILRRPEHRSGYIFYPLIQNRRFQVLLSSILQTYSAGRFRETPELERLFILMFDELSATDEYSMKGPDEETVRLISALHAGSLRSLDDIAAEARLTADGISEHIREYCGREAGAILREERMKHAAELLANKTTNLYRIAAECGYENTTAFSDDFRYYYGTSPEEYREQLI